MQRIKSWIMGFLIGSGISAGLVILFMPKTAEEIRRVLGDSYRETMEEARRASIAKRAELEAELAKLRDDS